MGLKVRGMESDCPEGMKPPAGVLRMFGTRQQWWLHNTGYTKCHWTVYFKRSVDMNFISIGKKKKKKEWIKAKELGNKAEWYWERKQELEVGKGLSYYHLPSAPTALSFLCHKVTWQGTTLGMVRALHSSQGPNKSNLFSILQESGLEYKWRKMT